jgi:hypothetical protein
MGGSMSKIQEEIPKMGDTSKIEADIKAIKSGMNIYALKNEDNAKSINSIKSDLGDYYKASEIDAFFSGSSGSLQYGPYVKQNEYDIMKSKTEDDIKSIKSSLGNYYNAGDINTFFTGSSGSKPIGPYVKQNEYDIMKTEIGADIQSVKSKFNNYYTLGDINTFFTGSSGSVPTNGPYAKQNAHDDLQLKFESTLAKPIKLVDYCQQLRDYFTTSYYYAQNRNIHVFAHFVVPYTMLELKNQSYLTFSFGNLITGGIISVDYEAIMIDNNLKPVSRITDIGVYIGRDSVFTFGNSPSVNMGYVDVKMDIRGYLII